MEEILDEEEAADQKLTGLAEGGINRAATNAGKEASRNGNDEPSRGATSSGKGPTMGAMKVKNAKR